ncbi:tetraspanin [Holotrichia oblita]|uniref:Tetraspanin n=1 Tax=Holotrichia oblita TaxID=644536 RepID=A0ACB9T2B6_HOLOL|nr:tetraspanin [Holotrichia oblita]
MEKEFQLVRALVITNYTARSANLGKWMYAVILIIILLLQIALVIYAFVKVNNPDEWRLELAQALGRLFETGGEPVDFVQQTVSGKSRVTFRDLEGMSQDEIFTILEEIPSGDESDIGDLSDNENDEEEDNIPDFNINDLDIVFVDDNFERNGLIGLAFIVIGVIYEVGFLEITNKLDEVFPSLHLASILLIVVGCIIFLISFLGCCGALRQNSCMLLTYAVILIIILLIQVGLAIYAFIVLNNSDDWRADLSDALGRVFFSTDFNAIDFIQQTLVGLAMLIVGVLYVVNFTQITDRLDELSPLFQIAPIILVIVGSVVMIISFFGCCGALRRNSCMLTTYGVALIIILILQIALVVFAFLQIRDSLQWQEEITTALEKLFADSSDAASQAIDFIQETLECCGVDEPPINPPASCCGGISPCNDPYPTGCNSLVYDFLNSSTRIIGIVAVSLGAIEVRTNLFLDLFHYNYIIVYFFLQIIAAILAIWTAQSRR